jgi:hypothetical protein
MKRIRISSLLVLCSLSAAFTCAAAFADDQKKDAASDDMADDEVTVDSVTVVRQTGDKFEEAKTFKSSDAFAALVKISDPKNGTKVKAVWTAIDAGGVHDTRVSEKEVTITPELLKSAKEPDRIDFILPHKTPYPAGEYKVEVYLDGELAEIQEFKIE